MRHLVRTLVVTACLGAPLAGCAHGTAGVTATDKGPDKRVDDRAAARRIYAYAERLATRGQYEDAIVMLRHAILQLPANAGADGLRHDLILRMGRLQILAYGKTGRRAHLHDAVAMGQRYLARHRQLFGARRGAERQRRDIESLRDEARAALAGEIDAPKPEPAAGGAPKAGPRPRLGGARRKSQAEDESDADFVRVITVKTRRRPRPGDRSQPRVAAYFNDPRFLGPSLLEPSAGERFDARHHVRARRLPKLVATKKSRAASREAVRVGLASVRAARTELRECYKRAFVRRSATVQSVDVEFSVDESGKIDRPRIVSGGLVDPVGDVCIVESLLEAVADKRPADGAIRVRVPLVFFFEGPKRDPGMLRPPDPSLAPFELPVIDSFHGAPSGGPPGSDAGRRTVPA